MDTPTLTLVPAHAADTASELTATWTPVDPATRTGCAWFVVPTPAPHRSHAA